MLISEKAAGPVTIGFRHPVLLAPERFIKECSSHDLLAAIAHECAHMKRHDFQKNLIYELASLAIAFHPVTWTVKSQIAQTREMICDEMATRAFLDSNTYAKALLRLGAMISLKPQAHSVNAMGILDANILEKRIMMIRAKKRQFNLVVKCGLMTAGAAVLFAVAAGSGTLARSVEAQSTTGQTDWTVSHSAKPQSKTTQTNWAVSPSTKAQSKTTHATSATLAPAKKQVDLSCTYYDYQNPDKQKRMIPIPGTCVVYKHEPYCAATIDKKLRQEHQPACEWKLRDAGEMP